MRSVLQFIAENWAKLAVVVSIAFIVTVIIFISLKIREKLMEKVVYRRVFSDVGAYEGEFVTLIETVYNPTPFPLFFVNVEGYIYNGIPMEKYEIDPRKAMQYYVSRFHLMPFMQIRRRHVIKCAKRGYYRLETVDIYYNKKVRYIEAPAEVYVYPKIVPLYETTQPTSVREGDAFTRRWLIKDPFSLNGIRDYNFGDSFNSINFKATARSGRMDLSSLKVNNRDFCSSRTFLVYLNFQTDISVPVSTSSYEAMMELGLSFSSAIIREASYSGYRAGFAANCFTVTGEDRIRFPIESGEHHLEEILKEMAKVRHKVGVSFFSLLESDIKSGLNETEIFIITPYISETLDEQIAEFHRFGNNVTVLRLEDEERAREEHAQRELAKLKEEKQAAEQERLKNSKDRQALEKILDAQQKLDEQNKQARLEREAKIREEERAARIAEAQSKTRHLKEKQAAREKLMGGARDEDTGKDEK
ncbi:MAG: DUF58 domain-containing protein [Eubacteriales bacterium]|nr:DUF58 domain-containing protein [Eubacteriales bacterium]